MGSWVAGIETITLFVDNLETGKAFYRDVLELGAIFEDAESDGHIWELAQ